MVVSDQEVEALRCVLIGRHGDSARVCAELDRAGGGDGLPALVAAAFTVAARDRFREPVDDQDVARFLTRLTTRLDQDAVEFDPDVAEDLLVAAAYGRENPADVDGHTVFRTEMIVLDGLVSERRIAGAELVSFLTTARRVADAAVDEPAAGGEPSA